MNNDNDENNNTEEAVNLNGKSYSIQTLEIAVRRVKAGEITAYKAQQVYNIPRSTLNNHVVGKSVRYSVGRPTMFNAEQEQMLLHFITVLSEYGFPPDKDDLKTIAMNFSSRFKIELNGKQWIPREDWLNG